MRAWIAALTVVGLLLGVAAPEAATTQQKKTTTKAKKPAPKPAPAPALKQEPAKVTCPAQLGEGVKSKRVFCDVLTGRNPAEGVLVLIPPHSGTATLMFDLHNRHTYSEQLEKAGRGFAEYTATIGVLLPDGTVLTRAAVKSSFRASADLVDRIAGGAGPGGVKAVAPVGTEPIQVEIPADVGEVSLLGEKLVVERVDARDTFTSPGRPIAIVSNVQVEYRPPPPKKAATAKKKPTTKKP